MHAADTHAWNNLDSSLIGRQPFKDSFAYLLHHTTDQSDGHIRHQQLFKEGRACTNLISDWKRKSIPGPWHRGVSSGQELDKSLRLCVFYDSCTFYHKDQPFLFRKEQITTTLSNLVKSKRFEKLVWNRYTAVIKAGHCICGPIPGLPTRIREPVRELIVAMNSVGICGRSK